jgi:hypothetical protein
VGRWIQSYVLRQPGDSYQRGRTLTTPGDISHLT